MSAGDGDTSRGIVVMPPRHGSPVDRGGGVRTWKLVTPARGARDFLTGVTEFDPGASLPLHFHNCQESVVVLEGTAGFDCDGSVQRLETGAATLIASGIPHRFVNSGAGLLRILWIYGSVEADRTLVSTGETRRISDEI